MAAERRSASRTPLLALLLVVGTLQVRCFNVDTKQPLVHRSQPNSGFGYSLDFYHNGPENL